MPARTSGSRTNNFDLDYEFVLSDTPDEQFSSDDITTFVNAISNFEGEFTDTDSDEFAIVTDGSPDIEVSNLTLDLQARHVEAGTTPTRFDGNLITESDTDSGAVDSPLDTARIEYKIGNTFSNENGELTEFVLIIEDEDEVVDGFQKDGNTIDITRATTDLSYIVEEGLFSLIDGIRVSGLDDGDGSNQNVIVSTENEVNNLILVTDDSATTDVDTTVAIDILANDSVPDGDIISIESFDGTSIEGGIVTLDDNGTSEDTSDDLLSYTPADGFIGSDSFGYTITDGTDTATATVNIEVGEDPNLDLDPIQAEDLNLTTYQIEIFSEIETNDDTEPADATGISLLGATDIAGVASLNTGDFSITPGTYDLTLSVFDENDGNAEIDVLLNGTSVFEGDDPLTIINETEETISGPIMLTEDTSSGFPTEDVRREFIIQGIETTNPTDIISIEGTADGSEWARIDFIEFSVSDV
ncbi:MAG: Ig-like domain-containing protein [Cyanobacteria bacterium P01_A01_bin.83]